MLTLRFTHWICSAALLASTLGAAQAQEVNLPSVAPTITPPIMVPATPPPALPATPPIALPDGGAVDPAQPLQTASLPNVDLPSEAFQLSLGNFNTSIMYREDDIKNLRRVLEIYESNLLKEGKNIVATADDSNDIRDLLASLSAGEELNPKDNAPLPNYYLSTILYRGPGNWALWVNGERFTSTDVAKREQAKRAQEEANKANQQAASTSRILDLSTPETKPTEQPTAEIALLPLEVIGISRDMVTFSWQPQNPARAVQAWQTYQSHIDNPPPNHRKARQSHVELDADSGRFVFSMRPNETFVPEEMLVLEGKAESPAPVLASDSPSGTAPGKAMPGSPDALDVLPEPAVNQSPEEMLADKLIDNTEKLLQIVPMPSNNPAPTQ